MGNIGVKIPSIEDNGTSTFKLDQSKGGLLLYTLL